MKATWPLGTLKVHWTVVLLAILLLLSGCAMLDRVGHSVQDPHYDQNYNAYIATCSGLDNADEFTLEGGAKVRISKPCPIEPPQSSSGARAQVISTTIGAATSLTGQVVNTGLMMYRDTRVAKERRRENEAMFDAISTLGSRPTIGGDGFIGDGSTGFTLEMLVEEGEEAPPEPVPEE